MLSTQFINELILSELHVEKVESLKMALYRKCILSLSLGYEIRRVFFIA